jgi:hypothetical protein
LRIPAKLLTCSRIATSSSLRFLPQQYSRQLVTGLCIKVLNHIGVITATETRIYRSSRQTHPAFVSESGARTSNEVGDFVGHEISLFTSASNVICVPHFASNTFDPSASDGPTTEPLLGHL